MKNDKISIVVPIYNTEKYLKKCIDSIVNQSYHNLEIILINDGSTDNSGKICRKYTKNHKNIIYKETLNFGGSIARNLGMSLATGKYIMFLDSDDYLESSAIEKLHKKLIDDNADFAMGNSVEITDCDNYIKDKHVFLKKEPLYDNFKLFLLDPYPGNKLYKMSIIKKNNIIFGNVRLGQDLTFFIKYLLFTKKIAFVNDVVSSYRIVQTGITRTYNFRIFDMVETFNDIEKFYRNNNSYSSFDKQINNARIIYYLGQLGKIKNYNRSDRIIIYKYFKKYINLALKNNCLPFIDIVKVYKQKVQFFIYTYLLY